VNPQRDLKDLLGKAANGGKNLWGCVAALCGAIVLVGGAIAVIHPDSGSSSVSSVSSAASTAPAPEAASPSFAVVISKACAGANEANDRAVRDGHRLRTKLASTRSSLVAKAAVIKTIASLENALIDESVLLSSATPPKSFRNSHKKALAALSSNVSWLQRYAAAVGDAGSRREAGRTFTRFTRMLPAYHANRARFRAALLRMGNCELKRTPTIEPVFAPKFYAVLGHAVAQGPALSPAVPQLNPEAQPKPVPPLLAVPESDAEESAHQVQVPASGEAGLG
jgi:hypothetical protein